MGKLPRGKEKCEFLKKIRKETASANGILLDETPCTHQGNCLGTCPKCDADLRMLTKALYEKEKNGEPVVWPSFVIPGGIVHK